MCFSSALEACTMLWFKMTIHIRLVYTIHVGWECQYLNCLRHVLCYINMLCLIANMFPRHTEIAYSFNTHCTFIIVHSHIPKDALQLHCTQCNYITLVTTLLHHYIITLHNLTSSPQHMVGNPYLVSFVMFLCLSTCSPLQCVDLIWRLQQQDSAQGIESSDNRLNMVGQRGAITRKKELRSNQQKGSQHHEHEHQIERQLTLGKGSRVSKVTRRWATKVGEVGVCLEYWVYYTTEEMGEGGGVIFQPPIKPGIIPTWSG